MSKEKFTTRFDGQEGIFVDENCCEDCTHLNCDVFDEEGDNVFHCEFPLNTTPEEISDFLMASADHLLEGLQDCANLELAYEKAETIRKHAAKILISNISFNNCL